MYKLLSEPESLVFAVPFIIFMIFFPLEFFFPLRTRTEKLRKRIVVNGMITLAAFIAAAVCVGPVSGSVLSAVQYYSFGILQVVRLPFHFEVLSAFILMDLSFYWWHRANHLLPLLWRFHAVHHIDPDLDTTTSFRFHAGEIALSGGFRAVQIGLIGVSPLLYMLHESVFLSATIFHHCNFRIPIAIERILNKLFVTPRMHGIHHSNITGETNSNYSVIFSVWDRLHHSIRLNISQSAITIGIPPSAIPAENSITGSLLYPFRRMETAGVGTQKRTNDNGRGTGAMLP